MESQSTKMRIKTYDPTSGLLLSDRLVEQKTEFNLGPKTAHNGPMTIEVNLVSQEDVDGLITYIKKLKGELPIAKSDKPKTTTAKQLDKMLSDKEPLLDLLKTLKAKAKNQEHLIEMLREYNFRFMATDVIKDYFEEKGFLKIKEKHEKYQWMARLVKEAKEPANDKYDFRLTFGIRFMGEVVDKVQIYWYSEYQETWKLAWKQKEDINFKKVEKVLMFPEFLDYADRKKWRTEHRKIERAAAAGTPVEPSPFYTKWKPYVQGL